VKLWVPSGMFLWVSSPTRKAQMTRSVYIPPAAVLSDEASTYRAQNLSMYRQICHMCYAYLPPEQPSVEGYLKKSPSNQMLQMLRPSQMITAYLASLGSALIRSLTPCAMELTRHLTIPVSRVRARRMFGHDSQRDMLRPELDIKGAATLERSPDEP